MARRQRLAAAAAVALSFTLIAQPALADIIDGTDDPNLLTGTAGDDTISGFGGDDTINALGGNDIVDGGDDNDTIDGGTGDDTLIVSSGSDIVDGGDDVDLFDASAATGVVNANLTTGAYSVTGGTNGTAINFENLDSGTANDILVGTSGNNVINGGAGNDSILSLDGNDTVNGDAGNDDINAAEGVDTVNGGAGDDTIDGGPAADTLDGGDGNDTVDFSQTFATQPIDFDLDDGTVVDGQGFTDTITSFESAIGTGDDDRIFGTSGPNRIDGSFGDDFLCGDGGADTLIGGYGNDLACLYDDTASTPATVETTIDPTVNDDQISDDDVVYDSDDPVIPIVYSLTDADGSNATINETTGAITLTPSTEGTVTLTYQATRGALSDTATVTITVTSPPPPTTDDPTTPTTDPGTTPTTDPGTTPTTDPTSPTSDPASPTTDGAVAGTGDRQGELPRTGGPLTVAEVAVGLMLVLSGLGLVLFSQQRQRAWAVADVQGGKHLAAPSKARPVLSAVGMITVCGYAVYDAVRNRK